MASEVAGERAAAPYFSALDGARALSIIAVFTWHLPGRPLADLNGFRGVTVFFVVSGLLITTLATREESRDGSLSLRSFYTRRCFRIFPLYYLVLAGYIAVTTVVSDPREAEAFKDALPYYFFYLQELPPLIGIENAPFEQSWSLGFEEKFYLAWPLLGFVVARRSNSLRGLIVASIAVVLASISLSDPTSLIAGLTFSYVPILIGCGLAIALSTSTAIRRVLVMLGRGAILQVAIVAVAMVALPGSALGEIAFSLIVAVALVGLLSDSLGANLLSQLWLVGLGRISYGFYLVHVMIISVVDGKLPGAESAGRDVVVALVAFAASVLLAYALHRVVELPLIHYGRKVVSNRRVEPVAN